MKKLILFASACIILGSCKKDRTCTCVVQPTVGPSTTYVVTLKSVSGTTASDACITTQNKDASGNVYQTTTCTLK